MSNHPTVCRLWFPAMVVGLSVMSIAGLWVWPNQEFPNDIRSFFANAVGLFAVLALAFWLLFLSGMRWVARVIALLLAVGLVAAAVRSVEFQGNLIPVFHFRWESGSW